MEVVSYNIENGAPHTYDLLKEFVREEDPEVLCLLEAENWHTGDNPRIIDFAQDLGYDSDRVIFGDSNTDSKIIVYSRLPIEEFEIIRDGFTHCAIRMVIREGRNKAKLVVSHLDPFSEEKRKPEMKRLIDEAADDGIIIADVNGLSRVDNYSEEFVRGLLQTHNPRYLRGEELLYEATDMTVEEGYVDVAVAKKALTNTYPARDGVPAFHNHVMRLDCAYVHPEYLDAIQFFGVIKNGLTKRIADHYPIKMRIDPTLFPHSGKPITTMSLPQSAASGLVLEPAA